MRPRHPDARWRQAFLATRRSTSIRLSAGRARRESSHGHFRPRPAGHGAVLATQETLTLCCCSPATIFAAHAALSTMARNGSSAKISINFALRPLLGSPHHPPPQKKRDRAPIEKKTKIVGVLRKAPALSHRHYRRADPTSRRSKWCLRRVIHRGPRWFGPVFRHGMRLMM